MNPFEALPVALVMSVVVALTALAAGGDPLVFGTGAFPVSWFSIGLATVAQEWRELRRS